MNKLENWKDEDWKLEVEICETKQNEVKRKLETKIEKEQEKRRCLEQEIKTLKSANKQLTKQVISANLTGRGPSSRVWQSYSRQQQLNKKKKLVSGIQTALLFCEEQRFKPCNIEIENIDTNKRKILNLDSSTNRCKQIENDNNDKDRLCAVTLVAIFKMAETYENLAAALCSSQAIRLCNNLRYSNVFLPISNKNIAQQQLKRMGWS